MDALPIYEIHKICRICLKSDLLVSIFSPAFPIQFCPIVMIEKLNIFKPDDNMPSLLCQSCLYRLLDAYNLQQLAEASERRLLQLSSSAPNLNTINLQQQELENVSKDDETSSSAIYANICDMFERSSGFSKAVAAHEPDDIQIDVSSLTRSEAADDTLVDVFVGVGHVNISCNTEEFVAKTKQQTIIDNCNDLEKKKLRCKRSEKVLKTPDECLECGKIFNYSGYLEAHKRIHTGEKPFKCKICLRRFTQSSNLLLHQRTHNDERRFQCEICSSFFTTSSNLKAHRLTHLEQRDFHCHHCERSFKSMRELRRHEPVHKSVKDIVCEVCQKAFTKRSYLTAHMATVHCNKRRHKCTECGKVFSNRSNLICHMRTHTGEKPFQCKLCTWKFNQSSALLRHMKKHLGSKKQEDGEKYLQPAAAISNDCLINNLLQPCVEPNSSSKVNSTPVTQDHNFSLLAALPQHQNAITQLREVVSSNGTDSTLSSATSLHVYDFAKDSILDFSTQQNQTQTLY